MKESRKRYRRSDTKIISVEAKVLRHLRETRGLSMRRAGLMIGKSDTFVCHCEHGRIDLVPKIIAKYLHAYGYEYDYYLKIVNGQIALETDIFEECLVLLKKLSKDKLKAVKVILQTF